jgi:hypothetical protein
MTIYHVPQHLLDDVWPSVEKYVERAQAFDPFKNTHDVYMLLSHGFASLFIATRKGMIVGFGVLEVVQYPSRRVANVMAAGGEYGFLATAIDDLLPMMIEHGRREGATVVTLSGRPGWVRALRRLNGSSKRFVTWWADIDEQGRRQLPTAPDDHAGTVEAGTTVSN